MQIMSSPKTGVMFGGAIDMGKNRRNIEKIINAVSNILKNKKPEKDIMTSNPVSNADEILKLKQLLDTGILTQDEFEDQNKIILKDTSKPLSSHNETTTNDTPQTPSASEKPLHIEGGNNDNTVSYCIIAVVVIVLISLLTMIE